MDCDCALCAHGLTSGLRAEIWDILHPKFHLMWAECTLFIVTFKCECNASIEWERRIIDLIKNY